MISMALMLGVQHGYDLDHLATIDSATRVVCENNRLSRMTGFLFSLGHGLVIISLSLLIGSGMMQLHIPVWLDYLGSWISILFLFLFGILTLWNVLKKPASPTMPVSIRKYFSSKIAHHQFHPFSIILMGALFAFSFDTFSQVGLFSIAASAMSGWLFAGILGVFFMGGMMATDGLNGLLVATLIQRADNTAFVISRLLGFVIAIFSLSIGIIGLIKMC